MQDETLPPTAATADVRPFRVLTATDLCQMPVTPTEWLVDGLLPAKGTSIVGASPKCGKSVFTRQLCAFVSSGIPFLGRDVRQGKTLYVSTQEPPERIRQHFDSLGCTVDTMPYVVAGELIQPGQAMRQLDATLAQHPGLTLVVLDMIANLLPIRDTSDYSEMNRVFAPVRQLAEKYRLHVCVTHHSKKAETENASHSIIGSQAIPGSFDQVIRLSKNSRQQRYIDTEQRCGESLPTTILNWNAERQAMYLGQSKEEAQEEQKQVTQDRIFRDIVTQVQAHPRSTRDEALSFVTGKATTKRDVFNQMVAEGHLALSGRGEKGDPHRYSLPEESDLPGTIAA